MPANVIYLVRHGETASNVIGRYAGRSAEPLLPSGRRQIARLAAELRGSGIKAIWTSGIHRAAESATILGGELDLPVTVDRRLDEMAMGAWEGLTEGEVAERFPGAYGMWVEQPDRLQLEGRETLYELAQRVTPALQDAAAGPEPRVLVTHVAPIRVATLQTLGLPLSLYKAVRVGNAECFVVDTACGEVRRFATSTSIRSELWAAHLALTDGKEKDL